MTNIQKLLVVIRLLEQMFLRHSSLESHKNTFDDVRNLLKDLSEKIKQLRTQYLLWKFQEERDDMTEDQKEVLFEDDDEWAEACKCDECEDKLASIESRLWDERVKADFPRKAGSQIQKEISSLQVVCNSYDRWFSNFANPLRDKITQLTVDVNNKDLHQRFMQRQKLECFVDYKKRKMEQELDVLQSMIKRSKY